MTDNLPALVDRAAAALAGSRTAAEVLEAKDQAGIAYDAAKRAARIAKVRGAHDELVAAAHRAQADALTIEAAAQRRLADEYDAAQERGEVVGPKGGGDSTVSERNAATAAELGLTRKEIYEAREVRDAEVAVPGIVARTLQEQIDIGEEPNRAALNKAIKRAAKAIRAEEQAQKKTKRAERERRLGTRILTLPTRTYGVILADPPWRFDPWSDETGMDRAADNHYPTLTLERIMALQPPAAEDCVLFLWVTVPFERVAHELISAWGFTYASQFVWVKDRIGTGYWSRNKHEPLLVATRGSPPAPAPGTQFASVIEAPVGRHSEKPERSYEIIETYFPTLPKLEMFARIARPGWDAWGNEVDEAA